MKKKTLGTSGLTYIGKSIGAVGPWGRIIEFCANVTPDGNCLFFALVRDRIPHLKTDTYLMDVSLKPISAKLRKTLIKNGVPAKLFKK